jgi:hypothetical protein
VRRLKSSISGDSAKSMPLLLPKTSRFWFATGRFAA